MTFLRSSTRFSRGIFRSSSKKNRASARRARITFSFPRLTTAGIAGEGVVDRQKVGQEVAFAVHDRKILLVGDHRGDEDLAGELEVFRVEIPADDGRVFGEEGDLFEKFIVPERLAPDRRRRLLGLFADDLFPLRGIDDDEMLPRLGQVLLPAADGKRARGS